MNLMNNDLYRYWTYRPGHRINAGLPAHNVRPLSTPCGAIRSQALFYERSSNQLSHPHLNTLVECGNKSTSPLQKKTYFQ